MTVPVLNKQFTYDEYRSYIDHCVENNCTSGNEQTSEKLEATKLNAVRIKRIDKQIELVPELKNVLSRLHRKLTWVILTEAWCGDGAQNIPVIAKIAGYSPNIELKIILRDDNPEIMDRYLTNGSRSVPKLVCFDTLTGNELGTWGARPAKIQAMVKEFKSANPNVSHDEFVKNLHLWYEKDKGEAVQADFIALIKSWL